MLLLWTSEKVRRWIASIVHRLMIAESEARNLRLQTTLLEMQAPVRRMATRIDYIQSSIEGKSTVVSLKHLINIERLREGANNQVDLESWKRLREKP